MTESTVQAPGDRRTEVTVSAPAAPSGRAALVRIALDSAGARQAIEAALEAVGWRGVVRLTLPRTAGLGAVPIAAWPAAFGRIYVEALDPRVIVTFTPRRAPNGPAPDAAACAVGPAVIRLGGRVFQRVPPGTRREIVRLDAQGPVFADVDTVLYPYLLVCSCGRERYLKRNGLHAVKSCRVCAADVRRVRRRRPTGTPRSVQADVAELRRLRTEGKTLKAIRAATGLSLGWISKLLRR